MRGTLVTASSVLALCVLLAVPLAAEQTGEIRGTITDATGAALPGVLVTARSPNLQGVRTTTSDAFGFFRLPALPVGTYELTFEISGFQKLTLASNLVGLGATTTVSATLKLAAFQEEVTVTAEAPLADRTKVDTSYRLTGDELARIPTQAKTIAEVVAFTPGVTGVRVDTVTGTDTGLPSFRGEGNAGNNWLVDGLSTKGVSLNDPGVRINYDAWQEVQVISDGFEPELGQALGGFVNIVTKAGGNAFKGEGGLLIRAAQLRAARQEQLSAASLPQTAIQQYFGNLGGPILKDRLWFFASDNYFRTTDTTTDQTIGWLTIPAGERMQSSNNVFGKGTFTPRPNHTVAGTFTYDTSLPQQGGIGVPETYELLTHEDYAYRINYTGILPRNTLLTAAVGQNRRMTSSEPLSGDYGPPSYFWEDISQLTNNVAWAHTDLERRTDLSVAAESFLELGRWGKHQVKAGLSHYWNSVHVDAASTGYAADPWPANGFDDGVDIAWTAPGEPLALKEYGKGLAKDSTNGFGMWVQDSVQVGRVAFMAGLRTDTQKVYNDAGKNVWSWGFGDFLQPRLSVAVDLTNDGRNVVKFAYGLFSMPLATDYLSWVNESFLFNFRNYDWIGPANPSDAALRDPANWAFSWEQSGAASPIEVDAGMRPNRVSKILAAYEWQIRTGWALRFRGVFTKAGALLEDIGMYAPDSSSELSYLFTNFEYKKRDYRALEVELNGRAGTTLMLDASYTWSRARGSVPGNDFEAGTWSVMSGGGYDGGPFGDRPYMPPGSANKELYDEIFAGLGGRGIGDEGWYGYLPYGVDHDVKVMATWQAPRGFQISGSVEYLSGYHWEKKGWVSGYGYYLAFPEGRGGRITPAHAYVDLAAEKRVALGKRSSLAVGVNIYNLCNSQIPVSYVKEDTEQFGQVWGRQLPLWAQITASVRF